MFAVYIVWEMFVVRIVRGRYASVRATLTPTRCAKHAARDQGAETRTHNGFKRRDESGLRREE